MEEAHTNPTSKDLFIPSTLEACGNSTTPSATTQRNNKFCYFTMERIWQNIDMLIQLLFIRFDPDLQVLWNTDE